MRSTILIRKGQTHTTLKFANVIFNTKCFCTKYVNYNPFQDVSFKGAFEDTPRGLYLCTEWE